MATEITPGTQSPELAPSAYADYNPQVLHADGYNNLTQQPSGLSGTVNNVFTKFAPAAMLSGLNSIANSAIGIVNLFPSVNIKEKDTYQILRNIDQSAANYYQENQASVDTAGFLIGSLGVGSIGVKALRILQSGKGAAASSANIFRNAQTKYLDLAIKEASTEGTNVFRLINANKMKSLMAGAGDAALDMAAFEVAVGATMFAAPTLDNLTVADRLWNAGTGIVLGGAIGGLASGISAFGRYNKAVTKLELDARPAESLDVMLASQKLTAGDAAFQLLNSVNKLPDVTEAPTLATKVLKTTEKANVEATRFANQLANGDADIGNTLISSLVRMKSEAAKTPTMETALFDPMEAMLVRLKSASRIGVEDAVEADQIYLRNSMRIEGGKFVNAPAELNLRKGLPKEYHTTPFRYIGDSTKLRISTQAEFATANEAFAAGADIFYKVKGTEAVAKATEFTTHVNPASPIIKAIPKGQLAATDATIIFNAVTGDITSTAFATLPDMVASKAFSLNRTNTGLRAGDLPELVFGKESIESLAALNVQAANGRFIFANLLPEKVIMDMGVIHTGDLPMLERVAKLVQEGKITSDSSLLIKEAGMAAVPVSHYFGRFDDLIASTKTTEAEKLFAVGKQFEEVSIMLNAPKDFLETGTGKLSMTAEELLKPTHVKLAYDVKDSLHTPDGMIVRGVVDIETRIANARELNRSITAAYYGEAIEQLPEFQNILKSATSIRQGPSALAASAGDFGSVSSKTAQVGKMTNLFMQRGVEDAHKLITQSSIGILQNPQAGVELGILMNAMRGTSERYSIVTATDLPPELAAMLFQSKAGSKVVHTGYLQSLGNKLAGKPTQFTPPPGTQLSYEVSQEVGDFLTANMQRNDWRLTHRNRIADATGEGRQLDPGMLYIPHIDTKRYKHFAYVVEDSAPLFGEHQLGIVVAKDEVELSRLTGQIPEGYKWYTKGEIANYHKARGDFNSDLLFSENRVNTMLKRKGILTELHPTTDSKALIEEWLSWHSNQEISLARKMAETHYAQEIKELRYLGERYTNLATSTMSYGSTEYKQFIRNPYEDSIKQMLNINKLPEYQLWAKANQLVESMGSQAFNAWVDASARVRKGEIGWEEANSIAIRQGYNAPFKSAIEFQLANSTAERALVSKVVNAANAFLATTILRIDQMNAIVNVLATPIMLGSEMVALRKAILAKDASLAGELAVKIPGTELSMGANIKLVYKAISNYFEDMRTGGELVSKYKASGILRDLLQQHHDMNNALAFTGRETTSQLTQTAKKLGDFGAKWSGNNFAEEFTRFVSANVMDQMTHMAGLSTKEASSYINTFVNRVHGNSIASQRPIAFQGPIGHAIGLFQTYQFNLIQQLLRHAENRDKVAALTMLGLQTSLFGMQGLPGFQAINTHIIGNAPGNREHKDIYSGIPEALGKDVGDWLIYGLPSNVPMVSSSLFTRGDINPRQMTILPSEFSQIPVVAATVKVVKNLWDMGQTIGDGGKFYSASLVALEHNGLSRPLAGLAQLVHGRSTTSQGKLISEIDRTAVSQYIRLVGSKPLDEAIGLEANYRKVAYQARDMERKKRLGAAMRSHFYGGEAPSSEAIEQFAEGYAASGGRAKEFNQFMMENMRGATTSVVNETLRNSDSPIVNNMRTVMGGEELPDYGNTGGG